MNEDINIAEILKDAPTGTLLYSPIFGKLAYIGSHALEGQTYSIIVCQYPDAIGQGDSVSVEFDENGTYLNRGYSSRRGGECMLFPSKENRDWVKFKVSKKHKHFEPFQKMLVKVRYNSRIIQIVIILALIVQMIMGTLIILEKMNYLNI